MNDKQYLGDGVYALMLTDGTIVLTTETGYDIPTNTVYLEPDVFNALLLFRRGKYCE